MVQHQSKDECLGTICEGFLNIWDLLVFFIFCKNICSCSSSCLVVWRLLCVTSPLSVTHMEWVVCSMWFPFHFWNNCLAFGIRQTLYIPPSHCLMPMANLQSTVIFTADTRNGIIFCFTTMFRKPHSIYWSWHIKIPLFVSKYYAQNAFVKMCLLHERGDVFIDTLVQIN